MNEPYPLSNETLSTIALFNEPVACGFPSPAEDHEQRPIDLNAQLIPNRAASYLFTVKSRSMEGVGIFEGDRIIVDRSVRPLHNHIVLAEVDAEYTVKRLYMVDDVVMLLPENPDYQPIMFTPGQQMSVWGVVRWNLRRLLV